MALYPKTIGGCIDKLYRDRARRMAAQKRVDALKEQEGLLEEHILSTLNTSRLEGGKGKTATAALARRTVARVKDWPAFFRWVKETDAFDMVQKRVNDSAFRERLEAGVSVVGVEPFEVVSLSLTKSHTSKE
jgi:hypothetical protein